MKKFLTFFLIILVSSFFSQNIFAIEKNITISAIVWAINVPSKIQVTSPDYLDEVWAVEYVENWSSFAMDFLITDNEDADIHFTITTDKWVLSVENWGPVWTSGWWYSNQFVFLAWSSSWIGEIVITSNDWTTVTSKTILVYVY